MLREFTWLVFENHDACKSLVIDEPVKLLVSKVINPACEN
jgi:hypothetical protein